MAQLFRPHADTILRSVLLALVVAPVLGIVMAYGVMRSPYITGLDQIHLQPIPFSHEHHVGFDGIDCRYCHTGVETSPVAGIPPTEICMTCHSQLFANAPLLAPARASLVSGRPIAWARVHQLPDYVYFDHSIHIAKGVGCTTCHGQVDRMPLMRQAQPMTMSWCLDCHRHPQRYLRPESEVFSLNWKPGPDQEEQGEKLLHQYLIDISHLTDCSVCHR